MEPTAAQYEQTDGDITVDKTQGVNSPYTGKCIATEYRRADGTMTMNPSEWVNYDKLGHLFECWDNGKPPKPKIKVTEYRRPDGTTTMNPKEWSKYGTLRHHYECWVDGKPPAPPPPAHLINSDESTKETQLESDEENITLPEAPVLADQCWRQIRLAGVPVRVMVDSGSMVSVIPQSALYQLEKQVKRYFPRERFHVTVNAFAPETSNKLKFEWVVFIPIKVGSYTQPTPFVLDCQTGSSMIIVGQNAWRTTGEAAPFANKIFAPNKANDLTNVSWQIPKHVTVDSSVTQLLDEHSRRSLHDIIDKHGNRGLGAVFFRKPPKAEEVPKRARSTILRGKLVLMGDCTVKPQHAAQVMVQLQTVPDIISEAEYTKLQNTDDDSLAYVVELNKKSGMYRIDPEQCHTPEGTIYGTRVWLWNRTDSPMIYEKGYHAGELDTVMVAHEEKAPLHEAYPSLQIDTSPKRTQVQLQKSNAKVNSATTRTFTPQEEHQRMLLMKPHIDRVCEQKHLTKEMKEQIAHHMYEAHDVFHLEDHDVGNCGEHYKLQLNTGDNKPIYQHSRKVAHRDLQELHEQVDMYLKTGVIQPSYSPWSSPVTPVRKSNGKLRLCIDYRSLNNITVKDQYALPTIQDVLTALGNKAPKWFTCMDLANGYNQVLMHDDSIQKTAFSTPDGLFEFLRMPFGLSTAPPVFQRVMRNAIKGMPPSVQAYLDDICFTNVTFQEHLDRFDEVIERFRLAGLMAQPAKCELFMAQLKYLGFILTHEGVQTDPKKVSAIANYNNGKPLKDKKEVKRFMGIIQFYRQFIKDLSTIARPLVRLTKQTEPWRWDTAQQEAFDTLREKLTTEPVILLHPQINEGFVIRTDACNVGLGAVLEQVDPRDDKLHPVMYASRTLNDAETRYSTTEQECLAAVWACSRFHNFVAGCKELIIVTDHMALKDAMLRRMKGNDRVHRWMVSLGQYNPKIVYTPGRNQLVADALSRQPETHNENDRQPATIEMASKKPLDDVLREIAETLRNTETDKAVVAFLKVKQPLVEPYRYHSDKDWNSNGFLMIRPEGDDQVNGSEMPAVVMALYDKLDFGYSTDRSTDEGPASSSSTNDSSDSDESNSDDTITEDSESIKSHSQSSSDDDGEKSDTPLLRELSDTNTSEQTEQPQPSEEQQMANKIARLQRRLQKLQLQANFQKQQANQDTPVLIPDATALVAPATQATDVTIEQVPKPRGKKKAPKNRLGARRTAEKRLQEQQEREIMKPPQQPGPSHIVHPILQDKKLDSEEEQLLGSDQEPVVPKQDLQLMREMFGRPEKFELKSEVAIEAIKEQDECPYLQRVAEILEDRVAHRAKPPKQPWDIPIIRLVTKQLLVRDTRGLICYHDPKTNVYRIAIPIEHREILLREAHKEGGHFQTKRVTEYLTSKYWWPGMTADINANVRSCLTCATISGQSAKPHPPLMLLEPTMEPGERVHVDILKVPPSNDGLNHILTIVDAYSKNIVAYALQDESAVEVAKKIVEYMAEYGPPIKVVSDQGTQFMGQVFQQLALVYAFNRAPTTTFHPQSNGQCERSNQIILGMLKRAMAENQDTEWPDYLHPCLQMYRAAPHSSTGYSPYYLERGRPMRLPSDTIFTEVFKEKYEDNPNYIARLSRSVQAAYAEVDDNLKKNQLKYKHTYDKRMAKRKVTFQAGDRVWYYDTPAALGSSYKFARPYTGPWLIEQIKGPVTAMIRRVDNRIGSSMIVHLDKLRHTAKEIPADKWWDGSVLHYIPEDERYKAVAPPAKPRNEVLTLEVTSATVLEWQKKKDRVDDAWELLQYNSPTEAKGSDGNTSSEHGTDSEQSIDEMDA